MSPIQGMKQSIKEDFRNFEVPKGTKIAVNEEEVRITSTNTNYFTIGFYCFFFFMALWFSLATGEILVLAIFGTPFVVLIVLNLFSKVEISLHSAGIEIKDGFFIQHYFSMTQIREITFGGTSIRSSNPFGTTYVSNTCTHVILKSGESFNVFKNAVNQKVMFRCISYFVAEQSGETW